MTGKFTCEVCAPPKGDGWHYSEDPVTLELTAYPCPRKAAEKQAEATRQYVADESTKAAKAAREIIRDKARFLPELSANDVRREMEHAGVPKSLIGGAFRSLAQGADPTLAHFDPPRFVMSLEETTRHRIELWRSLKCRSGAA